MTARKGRAEQRPLAARSVAPMTTGALSASMPIYDRTGRAASRRPRELARRAPACPKQRLASPLGAAGAAFAAGPADAQAADPNFTASIGDLFATEFGDLNSSVLLNQVFGPLFPSAAADAGATVFSALIGFVNLSVLAIAGVLFLYNAAAGVLQSAHEGELLGRRWSSLWAPIRLLLAVSMLFPIPGLGGYNAIQAGTAWLVRGATAMASEVWSGSARIVLDGGVPIAGPAARPDGALFKSAYRNQLCARIANHQFAAAGSPLRVALAEEDAGGTVEIVSRIGSKRDGVCGSYSIPRPPDYIAKYGDGAAALEQAFRGVHADVLEILLRRADAILDRQWPALVSGSGTLPDITADIAAAMEAAGARLAEGNNEILGIVAGSGNGAGAAREVVEAFISGTGCRGPGGPGSADCAGQGWIGAGNWYMLVARLNSETAGLLQARVSARESGYIGEELTRLNRAVAIEADSPGWIARVIAGVDADKYLHTEEALRIWSAGNAELDRSTARLAAYGFPLPASAAAHAAGPGRAGLIGRIWAVSFAGGVEDMINNFSPSRWGDDPLVGIVNMGNWCLDVAGSLLFGSAAVSLFSDSIANTAVFLVAAPLAAIGVTLSFVLPLLPFFYWVFAVIRYFLLVAEAVVASSLWALGHFRMDGEGISGAAGARGWLMLLSLTLTPTLMIVGYIVGIALFRIMSGLIDAGMFYAMSALTRASPLVAIFGLIASGALVVVAYIAVIERSFSLVSEFPSRTLAWVGGEAALDDAPAKSRISSGAGSVAAAIGSGAARLRNSVAGGTARAGF